MKRYFICVAQNAYTEIDNGREDICGSELGWVYYHEVDKMVNTDTTIQLEEDYTNGGSAVYLKSDFVEISEAEFNTIDYVLVEGLDPSNLIDAIIEIAQYRVNCNLSIA